MQFAVATDRSTLQCIVKPAADVAQSLQRSKLFPASAPRATPAYSCKDITMHREVLAFAYNQMNEYMHQLAAGQC